MVYYFILCSYSRHAAVSADANPLPTPSSDRPTSATQQTTTAATAAVVESPCPTTVAAANEELRHQQDADGKTPESPRGTSQSSDAVCKTECTTATTVTSSPRPICPNLPYSPACSPRFSRRRPPLRECRVSVNVQSLDDPNAHQKLNQYKLIDSIGQVCKYGYINRYTLAAVLKTKSYTWI